MLINYHIVGNRYVLLECMAISTLGKIYRARDLEQVQTHGADSQVLVHLLAGVLLSQPLAQLFAEIKQIYQQLQIPWVLAPLAYGQDDSTGYLVLASPNARNFHSLDGQLVSNAPLARKASEQLFQLNQQGYMGGKVDPALLLATATRQVYLLATALSPLIQAVETVRSLPVKRRPLRAVVASFAFGLFSMADVTAGSFQFAPVGYQELALSPVVLRPVPPVSPPSIPKPNTSTH